MPNNTSIITPSQAVASGVTADKILACAAWNDEMGAAAYNGSLFGEAGRLWAQAAELRRVAAAISIKKAA